MKLYRQGIQYWYFALRHWQGKAAILLLLGANYQLCMFRSPILFLTLAAAFAVFFPKADPLKTITVIGLCTMPFARLLDDRHNNLYRLIRRASVDLQLAPRYTSVACNLIALIVVAVFLKIVMDRPALRARLRLPVLALPVIFTLIILITGLTPDASRVAILISVIFFWNYYAALVAYMGASTRFQWSHLAFFYTGWCWSPMTMLHSPLFLKHYACHTERQRRYSSSLGAMALLLLMGMSITYQLLNRIFRFVYQTEIYWRIIEGRATQDEIRAAYLISPLIIIFGAASFQILFTAYFRLLGLRLPMIPSYPWRGRNFADIYRRFYMAYTQFILDNYFYPIFQRLPAMDKRWRIFIATVLCLFCGTFAYHLAQNGIPYLLEHPGSLQGFVPFVCYLVMFSLVLGWNLRASENGGKEKPHILKVAGVWIFFWFAFATLMCFRPLVMSEDPQNNFDLLFKAFPW